MELTQDNPFCCIMRKNVSLNQSNLKRTRTLVFRFTAEYEYKRRYYKAGWKNTFVMSA